MTGLQPNHAPGRGAEPRPRTDLRAPEAETVVLSGTTGAQGTLVSGDFLAPSEQAPLACPMARPESKGPVVLQA